jgi:hypothetical protein
MRNCVRERREAREEPKDPSTNENVSSSSVRIGCRIPTTHAQGGFGGTFTNVSRRHAKYSDAFAEAVCIASRDTMLVTDFIVERY